MPDSYEVGGRWLNALHAELAGSDRACAVLGGAVLDDRLKTLLVGYLIPPLVDKEDRLLGRSAPVESFSARIELAYRLALISEKVRRALDWTRDIRNEAAHSQEFSFESDQIRDRVRNMFDALELRIRLPAKLREELGSTTKGDFVASVMLLAMSLEVEAGESGRTKHVPANILGATIRWVDERDGD